MESTQECGHVGSGSECQACCIDIAAGLIVVQVVRGIHIDGSRSSGNARPTEDQQ